MRIPLGIKKRQDKLNALLENPKFAQTKLDNPETAEFLQEEVSRINREIKMWHLLDRMKVKKAERTSSTYHKRGRKLLSRTNPQGLKGVLLSTGHGPFIRFYSKDKSDFKDYDLGWTVDASIIIDDSGHELKEFEREDGTLLRVIEISEAILNPEIKSLQPGQSEEN